MVMVITPIMTVIHNMRGMDNLTIHAKNPKPEHTAGRQIFAFSPVYTVPPAQSSHHGGAVMNLNLDTPIQFLKGVGERRAAQFARLGVTTAGTLLRHYPRQYEDWTAIVPIASAPAGEPCCIRATAMTAPQEHRVRKGLSLFRFTATDGVSVLHITLFNNKYAAAKIRKGEEYLFFGTVGGSFRRAEMTSPLIEPAEGGARIRPIYPQTEGLTSRVIETAVANALTALGTGLDDDPLPFSLRQAHNLCTRRYALENIHFPTDHRALSGCPAAAGVRGAAAAPARPAAPERTHPRGDGRPDGPGFFGRVLAAAPLFPHRGPAPGPFWSVSGIWVVRRR